MFCKLIVKYSKTAVRILNYRYVEINASKKKKKNQMYLKLSVAVTQNKCWVEKFIASFSFINSYILILKNFYKCDRNIDDIYALLQCRSA